MSIVYPSDDLQIMDYNRVLKDLNGLSPAEFLQKLQQFYSVAQSDYGKPSRKHQTKLLLQN
jgi:uncharacterized protein (DUF1015 family)